MNENLSPESEALAFRIWAEARKIAWNCAMIEVADNIGEPIARVRRICAMKRWTNRFRASTGAICMSNRFTRFGVIGGEVYEARMELAERIHHDA